MFGMISASRMSTIPYGCLLPRGAMSFCFRARRYRDSLKEGAPLRPWL
jgi:hypothetical protein